MRIYISQLVFTLLQISTIVSGLNKRSSESDPANGTIIPDERKLIQHLFNNGYEKTVRPVKYQDKSLQVTFDLLFVRLVELDEKTRTLTLNVLIQKIWNDVQLTWKPEDFHGIRSIAVPINKIWVPDIVLYTNADDSYKYVMDGQAVVSHDGTVKWLPSAHLKSYCYFLDLARFPYDQQKCDLVFGSWTHSIKHVNVSHQNKPTLEYIYDGEEWDVQQFSVGRKKLSFHLEFYPTITYTIVMKRTGVYYVNMFVWPSVLLAFLTAFVFIIPHESGERLHVGVAVILASLLEMLLMNDHLPTEMGTFPVIGRFLQFNIFMATAAIMFSSAMQNFFYRNSKRQQVPLIVKRLFLGKLARMMCVHVDPYDSLLTNPSLHEHSTEMPFVNASDELGVESPLPRSPTLALEKVLDEIRQYLKVCANKAPSEPMQTTKDLILNEWRRLALVFDRLFFCLYMCTSVLVAVFLLH